MVNCSGRPGQHTPFVLIVALILVGVAVVSRAGRSFASGFAGGLVLMAVLTAGSCTPSWSDPYGTYRARTAPARLAKQRAARDEATLNAWTSRVNARPMDVPRGVAVAGEISRCVHRVAEKNGGRFPVSDAEIRPCDAWDRWGVSSGQTGTARYRLPDDPPREQLLGLPTTPRDGDPGWRAQYELTPDTHFLLTVAPDEQLTHRWPRIYMNGLGRIDVQRDENAPRLEISPVDDLRLMAQCLNGMQKDDERREARGLAGSLRFTPAVQRLCPPLATRVKHLVPIEDDRTFLSMFLPVGPGGAREFVAGWVVQFVQRRDNDRYHWDLVALPWPGGLLSYTVAMEGEIRSTRDPSQAR